MVWIVEVSLLENLDIYFKNNDFTIVKSFLSEVKTETEAKYLLASLLPFTGASGSANSDAFLACKNFYSQFPNDPEIHDLMCDLIADLDMNDVRELNPYFKVLQDYTYNYPAELRGWTRLGDYYQHFLYYEDAIECFLRAKKIDPTDVETTFKLWVLGRKTNDLEISRAQTIRNAKKNFVSIESNKLDFDLKGVKNTNNIKNCGAVILKNLFEPDRFHELNLEINKLVKIDNIKHSKALLLNNLGKRITNLFNAMVFEVDSNISPLMSPWKKAEWTNWRPLKQHLQISFPDKKGAELHQDYPVWGSQQDFTVFWIPTTVNGPAKASGLSFLPYKTNVINLTLGNNTTGLNPIGKSDFMEFFGEHFMFEEIPVGSALLMGKHSFHFTTFDEHMTNVRTSLDFRLANGPRRFPDSFKL